MRISWIPIFCVHFHPLYWTLKHIRLHYMQLATLEAVAGLPPSMQSVASAPETSSASIGVADEAQVSAPVSVRLAQMKRQLQYFTEHNMHAQAAALQKEARISPTRISPLPLSLSLSLSLSLCIYIYIYIYVYIPVFVCLFVCLFVVVQI